MDQSPNFQITTVDWEWPKPVNNKEVYRPDEFIKTATKEEALEAIDFLLKEPQGSYHYTITVCRDGEYYTYNRHKMPCLGGLVKYKDTHGKKFSVNSYFPRDIKVSFPLGEIIYIGVGIKGIGVNIKTPYLQFLFSEESPWVAAFGSPETVLFRDNHFIITNMDAEPTVFYSLLRLGSVIYNLAKKGWHPKADILLNKSAYADPRRLAGQRPIVVQNQSWSKGHGYIRPWNESIFKTSLPFQWEKLTSSPPNVEYSDKYFRAVMKDKFGVDVSKPDQKVHDALMDAWDFFKEESKDLKDFLD